MKIIFICQNYYPLIGGVETQARLLAHELSKEHEVSIIGGNFYQSELPGPLKVLHENILTPSYKNYKDCNIQIYALTPSLKDRIFMLPIAIRIIPRLRRYFYHKLNRFGYIWYKKVYLSKISKIMEGFDVVHSLAGGYLGWTAQAAAEKLDVPFVCTPYAHPGQWGCGEDDIKYYNKCNMVCALLGSDKKYLESLGVASEKIEVTGVAPIVEAVPDPEQFRRNNELGKNPFILFIGRITEHKGVKTILESAEYVWKEIPQAYFVFIGPSTKESKTWFKNRDKKIVYFGKVSDQEKSDALAACDIFCMPSVSEIFPAAYLEAWSFGKPCIGGTAPGLVDLIEGNKAGMIVRQDPQELSKCIIKLLKNLALRRELGENGKKLIERKYNIESLKRTHLDIYKIIINQKMDVLKKGSK